VKKRWETILSTKFGEKVDLSKVKEVVDKYGLRIQFNHAGKKYRLKGSTSGTKSGQYQLHLLK